MKAGGEAGQRMEDPIPELPRLHNSSSLRAMHRGPCAGGAAQDTSVSCCKRKQGTAATSAWGREGNEGPSVGKGEQAGRDRLWLAENIIGAGVPREGQDPV